MPSPWQVVGEVAGVFLLVLVVRRLNKADAVLNENRIEPKVWEQGRKELRKHMEPKPIWLRKLEKRWTAAGRLGSRITPNKPHR